MPLLSEFLKDLPNSKYMKTRDAKGKLPEKCKAGCVGCKEFETCELHKHNEFSQTPEERLLAAIFRDPNYKNTRRGTDAFYRASPVHGCTSCSNIHVPLQAYGAKNHPMYLCEQCAKKLNLPKVNSPQTEEYNKQFRTDALPEIDFQGLTISIENPEGSIRRGEKEDGSKWETTFFHPYGFIKGTKGADGEEIDCFVGPNETSQNVYLIRQNNNGKYDEDKVMLGFDNEEHARDAYLAHYDTQMKLGEIIEMPFSCFKELLENYTKDARGNWRNWETLKCSKCGSRYYKKYAEKKSGKYVCHKCGTELREEED